MISDIASQLGAGPFTVARARQLGLSWRSLQTPRWTRLSRGQYCSSDMPREIRLMLRAVEQRLPREHAFSGLTAAWMWGLNVSPSNPIEVTIGRDVPVRARAGISLRRAALPKSDVVVRRGFRVTSPFRTVRDLGSRPDAIESVVAVDMALHMELVALSELISYVDTHSGEKGIKRLRRAIRSADARSESPMETRLRMHLIKAGLPVPQIQAQLHDARGEFVGRVDLYYSDCRLVIEYDGENHKDRLTSDVRRQNALVNAGYQILRFTSVDLRVPESIVAQVRQARAILPKSRSDSPDYQHQKASKHRVSPD